MKSWPLVFLLVSALPAVAEARPRTRPCDDGRLGHLENALVGERLVQSERMIATLQADCGDSVRFSALMARFALQSGRYAEAYGLYASLVAREPADIEFAAGAGRSALHLGRDDEAFDSLRRATASSEADWQAWNAIGILHDRRRQWAESEQAYARAAELSPYAASVWSNRGYSLMLQRRAAEAIPMLDRAAALDPNNATIRRTRVVAYALNGTYDETRRQGESTGEWARRLNNIGYAAWLAGDAATARRLLSQAIEVSETRFERAEHNLARVEGRE
jgi:Flp pilus assembly protein TadD